MSTVPEAVRREPAAPAADEPVPATRPRRGPADLWLLVRWPLGVYAASRLLYLLIAIVDTRLHGWQLGWELSNWDGFWYLLLAATGYPTHVLHTQSTLGFLPLYPLLIFGLQHALSISPVLAGIAISTIGGAVATVLVGRLSARWWGEAAGRRAVVFFCLFPGSIVFTMLYTEGLMLALVAGCLLALERRRWFLAGILAAFATATGPTAAAIIPACAAAAALELRRERSQRRPGRRAASLRPLLAPLLAPVGLLGFGAFLWVWTGDPLASFRAQRYAWHNRTTPLALVHTASKLVHQIARFHSLHHPGINLNYPAGLLGAVFLLGGLVLLWRSRGSVPVPALVWTLGLAALTLTSANTPPNPRMLLVAFPAVTAYAARLQGRAYRGLILASTVLLVAMSIATYVGTGLRP